MTLLRLSPLLPLALSNYLYGLTSVDLGSYVLGSWAGMLPGTVAYVAAGAHAFLSGPNATFAQASATVLMDVSVCWQTADCLGQQTLRMSKSLIEGHVHLTPGADRLAPAPATTGSYGRALLDGEGEGLAVEPWQVALGIGFTLLALLYIGRVAKTVCAHVWVHAEGRTACGATEGAGTAGRWSRRVLSIMQALDEEEARQEEA